ncbi:putative DEAD-box ATP-dependent RNA helicase [Actinomadura rubteroloni]|uniref:Putative DEAD-box ATP-dependent RNA helicase n=1 Tax=Actinomadura rubteroloni TaxID=1926885 RepID=A0A2P4UNL1_9ACTN|nr:DEAD/DEAH box helicase [Actinomadura rubteroloni]POM26625.1 putative DEAD-box ATP-dependent RNA helicase [Actinomadura rubteroloni]
MSDLDPVVLHHVVNSLGWPGLRPAQRAAVEPVLAGRDVLVLAPTAGGKTESAVFPLLTAMTRDGWTGLSVLYICPLRALLNSLGPRLESYTGWLGRRAAVWHGDVSGARRRALRADPPDVLLTTPESIEGMLIGTATEHTDLLAGVRAVVVDEVHAFAGDDRGWHLLAVLERLERVAGRRIQRVGLSATVGNPSALLIWLQGARAASRDGLVVAPAASSAAPPDITLDHVGSLANAAKVVAALHRGSKRLVFCDSRRQVEELGSELRARGVTVFLSHASLSADERVRSEQAFAEARDCVIVATSTLELGIDVGDLDRVIQIDAPSTVAAFLQRLGRTGRRPGTVRNCLFLATTPGALVQAAGLLTLWADGWVEPVLAPPEPRHLVAQQLLALALQNGTVGDREWASEWNGLAPFDRSAEPIVRHLIDQGYLEIDGGLLFIGPEAEKRFGRRHFMELTASFTAPPQFTVLFGRQEIGRTDTTVLTERREGPRRVLLGGRSWQVRHVDWKRRRAFVEPVAGGGVARWNQGRHAARSFALVRAMRSVLLGADPPVTLTRRARDTLAEERARVLVDATAAPDGTTIVRTSGDVRWWTWAGHRANATLAATLGSVADPAQQPNDLWVRLRQDLTPDLWHAARATNEPLTLPDVDPRAVHGLKFAAVLPPRLAVATLAARLADLPAATEVLAEPTILTGLT